MRTRMPSISHILSWAVFLFWSGVFAIYYFSGDYVDFLNPQFSWLVLMAFILNLVFFVALFTSPGNGVSHHHHHHAQHGSIDLVRLMILLAPILYVAGFESGNLGRYAFEKRAINVTRIDDNARNMARNMEIPGDLKYYDLLVASVAQRLPTQVSLIDIHADFEKLVGSKIQTRGMLISNAPGVPPGKFVIFRFVMVCCVADAQPVAVVVNGKAPEDIANERWVEIEGILEKTEIEGNPAAVINADRIVPAPAPENPYLTPRIR
ncbi:MAG: TIGR03943 family protein [Candidatus Riflebacteria bacterium]